MDHQTESRRPGKGNLVKMALAAGIAAILIKVFAPQTIEQKVSDPDQPFSMKTCMESVPETVEGLKVIEGSRSTTSIIQEMVPIVCKAKAVFQEMTDEGADIKPGSMILRVVIEYNGEVISASIHDSDITYRPLRNKIIDMVAETDFTSWQREDTDTIFLYPVHLGR